MNQKDSWFSDDAAADVAQSLGRRDFVERVWEVIRQSHSVESSTVFGLVGPWGTGKTSILDWLEARAAADKRKPQWTTVRFNPWDYPDADSLQLGFFNELSSAFSTQSKFDQTRAGIAAFGRSVAPFAAIGSLFGANWSPAVAAAAELIDGDRSATAARARLEAALKAGSRPILIVIDDLDRVTADELLLTLKLVRQLGRLPYVHYLLSYDETTILDVLTRTTLIGAGAPARARDYMEKVVQVRFDIPGLRPADALRLVNQGFDELSTAGFKLNEADTDRFSTAYFSFLASRFTTPRALKRYFSQLRLLSASMTLEIDLVDFLILTWIRTLEPGVYSLLQARRGELTGSDVGLVLTQSHESREQAAERTANWRKDLLDAGTREKDVHDVAKAIGSMFPRFAGMWSGHSASDRTRYRGVASDSYFDRYFSFGLTDDDIADATVRESLLAHRNNSTPAPSDEYVKRALAEHPALLVSKLARELETHGPATPSLLSWLGRLYTDIPVSNDLLTPDHQLESQIALQLRSIGSEHIGPALEALAQVSVDLLAATVERAQRDYQGEKTLPLQLDQTQTKFMRSVLAAHFADAHPLEMSTPSRSSAWCWSRIDPAGFGQWIAALRQRLGDLDSLGFFVNSSVTLGTKKPVSRLRGFDRAEAVKYFDLQQMRADLESAIAQLGEVRANDFDGPLDTPENRRRVALAAISSDSNE